MNYNDFDKDTQSFLNKAMDIYSIIKDKNICKRVKDTFDVIDYTFTRLDKKILSLFISGFLLMFSAMYSISVGIFCFGRSII